MGTGISIDVKTGATVEYEAEVLPPPVPHSVTPRQAKLALLGAGLLDGVDAVLEAIPNATMKRAAQIEWEYAIEFRRDAPLISQIGSALGLDDGEIDALFIAADAL